MRVIVFGLIAGAIGAVVWGLVVLATGYEYGWIAWGIGGLVGFAVALGNKDESRTPTAAGVVAVVVSAVSILGGKYLSIELMMPSDDEIVAMFVEGFEEEEYVVSFLADDVAEEFEAEGRMLEWPEDVDPEYASAAADYPADVWAEAEARWGAMAPEERTDFAESREAEVRANIESSLPELRAAISGGGFFSSFSPMDLIFFGLAMTTAFGLGSGGKKTEEELAAEYAEAVQLAMLKVMIADGTVDEEEVRAVTRIYQEMTGAEISDDVVRAKATLARDSGKDLQSKLEELAPHLSDEGKANVLAAGVRIAIADGQFEASEQALLTEIGRGLGMTEEQMRQTVSSLTQAAGTNLG